MRIALLSTSDTDLLSARASGADWVLANPARPGHQSMAEVIEGCDLVVGRLLGSSEDLCSGFTRIAATGMPVVVLGGEQTPSAELMEQSSVPIGIAAEAHRYLAEGGPENLRQLHAFLSDTVLLTGEGFEAPAVLPAWGYAERDSGFVTGLRPSSTSDSSGTSAKFGMLMPASPSWWSGRSAR